MRGAVPSNSSKADENTGISTDESLPVLSLIALAHGNPINTGSPKALTSYPPGLGVRWLLKLVGGEGEEPRHGGVPPSRIRLLPFGKIISYSFRSVGDSRI